MIVPQLYYVPESELSDEVGTSAGSMATVRDMSYKLEVRREPMPFLWAQSVFYSAKLLRELFTVYILYFTLPLSCHSPLPPSLPPSLPPFLTPSAYPLSSLPSVFLTGEGLISVSDLDPLGLRLPPHTRQRGVARHLGFKAPGQDTIIQVALIAETSR